jgi:phage terminase large subunit GpA-like protein
MIWKQTLKVTGVQGMKMKKVTVVFTVMLLMMTALVMGTVDTTQTVTTNTGNDLLATTSSGLTHNGVVMSSSDAKTLPMQATLIEGIEKSKTQYQKPTIMAIRSATEKNQKTEITATSPLIVSEKSGVQVTHTTIITGVQTYEVTTITAPTDTVISGIDSEKEKIELAAYSPDIVSDTSGVELQAQHPTITTSGSQAIERLTSKSANKKSEVTAITRITMDHETADQLKVG